MNTKTLIWIGAFVGGTIGGFVPMIFGADSLSFAGIIGSTVGGLVGIWAGFKLSQMI